MAGLEGHDAPSSKPLNPSEVKAEAQKLEASASKFLESSPTKLLTGANDVDAFEAFHDNVVELQSHGVDSVKQVFQQMQDDSKGLNPLLPNVTFTETNDPATGHKLELSEFPSLPSELALNQRHLDTEVSAEKVDSYGKMGKDGPHEWLKKMPNEQVWTLGDGEIQASTQKPGDKKPE
jgi:hypothetical protein